MNEIGLATEEIHFGSRGYADRMRKVRESMPTVTLEEAQWQAMQMAEARRKGDRERQEMQDKLRRDVKDKDFLKEMDDPDAYRGTNTYFVDQADVAARKA